MPKVKYAIEKGGPKRLEISWKGNWDEFTVRMDGNIIGSISDHEQLKTGQQFSLEDGSCLKVQLKSRSIFSCPQVLKDGQPLHPSGLEAAQRLSIAYKFIFLIAAFNLIAGLTGFFFQAAIWNLPPAGLKSVVVGILFLILAFFVMRKSMIALAIAVGIFAADLVFAVIFRQDLPRIILIAAVVFRVFVLLAIAQGFGAIKALKQNQTCANHEE